jgi:hypothetical protein
MPVGSTQNTEKYTGRQTPETKATAMKTESAALSFAGSLQMQNRKTGALSDSVDVR